MSMSSTLTALTVLETVARTQPIGLSDLARTLRLPKSTVQRCLATLHEAGWIEPESADSRRWVVGMRAFTVAVTVVDRSGLRDQALPVMAALGGRTEETIHLAVPDGREIVLVERVDSPHPLRAVSAVGARAPLHASSNGKAILASFAADDLSDYLRHGLAQVTTHTLTDESALREELQQVRASGYAISREEYQEGVVSVAAAVTPEREQRPIASLSISGPRDRMLPKVETYGPLVLKAATELGNRLPNHR